MTEPMESEIVKAERKARKQDQFLARFQGIVLVVVAVAVIGTLLIHVFTSQSNDTILKEMRQGLCTAGIDVGPTPCPPPNAAQQALTNRIAAEQAKRDAVLLKKIQQLIDRPTKVVVVEGPSNTRTIIVTRTVEVCKTPAGKPC